jgi:hypothetical protein
VFLERVASASLDERMAVAARMRQIGRLKVWQQADDHGPMTHLERAEFLLRRLYPDFPEVQLRQVLDELAAAEAAGTWHGFQRPDPLEPAP